MNVLKMQLLPSPHSDNTGSYKENFIIYNVHCCRRSVSKTFNQLNVWRDQQHAIMPKTVKSKKKKTPSRFFRCTPPTNFTHMAFSSLVYLQLSCTSGLAEGFLEKHPDSLKTWSTTAVQTTDVILGSGDKSVLCSSLYVFLRLCFKKGKKQRNVKVNMVEFKLMWQQQVLCKMLIRHFCGFCVNQFFHWSYQG